MAANFSGQSNVRALPGDGAQIEFDAADVIYVNAGVTRPADIWLDRLNDGGRLILPLTSDKAFGENPENIPIQRRGAVFGIKRRDKEFLAKWISAVAIFPCEGARDAESERALAAAFKKGGWERATRLCRRGDLPDEQCWLKGPDLVPGLRTEIRLLAPREMRVPVAPPFAPSDQWHLAEAKYPSPAPRRARDCAASKVGCGLGQAYEAEVLVKVREWDKLRPCVAKPCA